MINGPGGGASSSSSLALVEDYPALKADGHFQQLMTQMRELEDNIEYARRYYNAAVRDYNIVTEVFPSNIIASAFSFAPEEFFELDAPDMERKRVAARFVT
jgi:LemA protein